MEANFEVIYKPGNTTSRPDEFRVTYSVKDGPKEVRKFGNRPEG